MAARRSLPVIEVDPGPSCAPMPLEAPLSRAEAASAAQLFKALADPARLQLLSLIGGSSSGEACVCDLTAPLGLSQPTVSHHLKVLVDAGILTREKRGTWSWYAVVPDRLTQIAALLPT
jgi:ArsR family transcriptional regulator